MTGKEPAGRDMRILAVVNRYTERKYLCLSGSWMGYVVYQVLYLCSLEKSQLSLCTRGSVESDAGDLRVPVWAFLLEEDWFPRKGNQWLIV